MMGDEQVSNLDVKYRTLRALLHLVEGQSEILDRLRLLTGITVAGIAVLGLLLISVLIWR